MRLFYVAVTAFAICAFGGFAFTAFFRMTLPDWWLYPALRVGCQLGTAAFLGVAIGRLFGAFSKPGLVSFGICTTVGALLCACPLLDLLEGPARIEGVLVRNEVNRSSGKNRRIEAILEVRTRDGAIEELSPVGVQANRWEEMGCERTQQVSITALRHLDIVLDCRRLTE